MLLGHLSAAPTKFISLKRVTILTAVQSAFSKMPLKMCLCLIFGRHNHAYIHTYYILCRNGTTKCGIFVAAYNMLMKFKHNEEVDLDEVVLEARLRRPQFISTMVSTCS